MSRLIATGNSRIGVSVGNDDKRYGEMSYFENYIKKSAAMLRFYLDKGLFIIPIIASYTHAFRDHLLLYRYEYPSLHRTRTRFEKDQISNIKINRYILYLRLFLDPRRAVYYNCFYTLRYFLITSRGQNPIK